MLGVLAAAPSFAAVDPAVSGDCDPTAALFTADPAGLPMLAVPGAPVEASIGGPAEQTVCNAMCWDGSYVTCWGTSCTARDSSCSTGQRGYCWGSTTGYRYCPPCPCSSPCSATAICSNGLEIFCSGCSGDCFGVDECYAYCDGKYYWCPDAPLICPV